MNPILIRILVNDKMDIGQVRSTRLGGGSRIGSDSVGVTK